MWSSADGYFSKTIGIPMGINCAPLLADLFLYPYEAGFVKKNKVREKSRKCHNQNRSPSQTPRGRENRQIQTSTNQTNVRKALRLALSFPSEVIAMLKGQ